jgi:hypothetical protein
MNVIQIILISVGIIVTITVLTLTIANTVEIKKLKKYIFGVLTRLDDENYSFWKEREKNERRKKRLKKHMRKSATLRS